ncbi:MAG: ZIP family metal transporter [Planctomycetota bacterium]|nr:ZIP family metal transporter [Planctomycetota bacterium]
MDWILITSLEVFLLTLVGGVLPVLLRRGARLQHLLASVAAGVFLGAVFLHLLPEVGELAAAHGAEDGHEHGGVIWIAMLAGVVALFLVEQLLLRRFTDEPLALDGHDHDHPMPEDLCHEDHLDGDARHRMVGLATMVGLSLHAFTDGLGLSAGHEAEGLREALTAAVLSHKAIGGFSLGAALMLARLERRRVLLLLVVFAAVTPLGAILRVAAFPDLAPEWLEPMTAFAAGTFLYVALCDLLPEVFHERRDGLAKLLLLLIGLGASHFLHSL